MHDTVRAGRHFMLTSSHVCAYRYMRQNIQDVIDIFNSFGYADIF